MSPEVVKLFNEYVTLTGDKAAAANLVLADAMLKGQETTVDIREAARRLGISKDKMYELCKQQRIPFSKLSKAIRIRVADLDEYRERASRPAVRDHLRLSS